MQVSRQTTGRPELSPGIRNMQSVESPTPELEYMDVVELGDEGLTLVRPFAHPMLAN